MRFFMLFVALAALGSICFARQRFGPMSRADAVRLIYNPGNAVRERNPEERIRILMMSDEDLVLAARGEPEPALKEARGRNRPSVLQAFINALDTAPEQMLTFYAIGGIEGLHKRHPESPAGETLVGLLKHPRLAVRAAAANTRRDHKSADIPANQVAYLKAGEEPGLLIMTGRSLLSTTTKRYPDLIRQAKLRASRGPRARYNDVEFDFLLAEHTDPEAVNKVRKWALDGSDPHRRLIALQVMCRSRGVKELALAEKNLTGRGDLRTVAMHWVFYFGKKSSIAKLRASAKDPKQNLSGSQYFRSIPKTMLEFADKIEKGERGPRPPDNYYKRGSGAAWKGERGLGTAATAYNNSPIPQPFLGSPWGAIYGLRFGHLGRNWRHSAT